MTELRPLAEEYGDGFSIGKDVVVRQYYYWSPNSANNIIYLMLVNIQ